MTNRELPERPSLEHLKKRAKRLLRDARAKDPAALRRFTALPSLAGLSVEALASVELALHDAQSVIAREHGFASWNALRERVEELTLSFAAAADEFVRCATGDAPGRAERLLALHPGVARASLQAELVLGDFERVDARLRERPELANEAGGPQDWVPLLYVCHTCLHRGSEARAEGLVAIARRLLELGADPNTEYHWQWHPELPRTALWGALIPMGHPALAELLLEAGAEPTDGVSAHIAAGSGNLAALERLHRHGLRVDGIPGGAPPLAYVLGFARDAAGPRWLLEHGADPDLAWSVTGEAPVHVAARRWDVAMLELLRRHGAELAARSATGASAHTIAALQGNDANARWLVQHGAQDELTPLECFVAACARGDGESAASMLRGRPELRGELRAEHHLLLQRAAERGDVAALDAMLACGFDPSARDRDGVTALHRAAMGGHAEAVRALIEHGAPVDALDGMFAASPLIWAVEGWRHERGGDHTAVARRLLAAGASPDWVPPESTPSPEGVFEHLAELRRQAEASR